MLVQTAVPVKVKVG